MRHHKKAGAVRVKRCVVRGGYSHRAGLVAGIFSSWSKQWGKARENGWRPCWRSEHRSERPRSMGSCWAELPVHVVATAAPLARRESLWGDRRQRVLAAPHTLLLVHPPATALCSLAGSTWERERLRVDEPRSMASNSASTLSCGPLMTRRMLELPYHFHAVLRRTQRQ